MIKNGVEVLFTEDDKSKLVVRKFSDTESEEYISQYKKRNRRRRVIQLLIMFVLAVPAVSGYKDFDVSFFSIIGIVVVALIFILFEITNILNKKAIHNPYCIEVVVDRILDTEIETYSTDFSSVKFYPIEGTDTTSGYRTLLYVSKEEYEKAKCGNTLRIKVKGEKL